MTCSDTSPLNLAIHTTSFLPRRGGAEIFTAQLAQRLSARGHQLKIRTGIRFPESIHGIDIRQSIPETSPSLPLLWLVAPYYWGLREMGRLRAWTGVNFIPLVSSLLLAARKAKRRYGTPYVARIATLPGAEGDFADAMRSKFRKQFLRALREADRVVVLNHQARTCLRENHDFAGGRIAFIPNGVDTDRFHPASEMASSAGLQTGFVGRLTRQKGADLLLDFMQTAEAADICWHVVGDGQMRGAFEALAHARSNVNYTPELAHDKLPDFYRQLDCFFLPSRAEGMSNAVLEALASGLPVLLGDNPANREFSECAFLADTGSPGLFAGHFSLLKDKGIRMQVGKKARDYILKKHRLNDVVSVYERLFHHPAGEQ